MAEWRPIDNLEIRKFFGLHFLFKISGATVSGDSTLYYNLLIHRYPTIKIESHSYDITAIIDEEEKGRHKVHYRERNTNRARASNLNANATYEKSRPWKTPSYRCEGVPKERKCYIHPASNHQTIDCWQFLEKDVQQLRSFARENGLCFYCLCKHFSADCLTKSRCVICQGTHSKLLQVPVQSPKRPLPRSNHHSKQESVKSSTINLQAKGKINAAKGKAKEYTDKYDCSFLVPVMALTAVKKKSRK